MFINVYQKKNRPMAGTVRNSSITHLKTQAQILPDLCLWESGWQNLSKPTDIYRARARVAPVTNAKTPINVFIIFLNISRYFC